MIKLELVKTQTERLIEEFNEKNKILQNNFVGINPFDFYFELFKSYEPDLVYISGDKKTYNKIEKATKACDTENLLINYAQFRDDVYIPPAIFFKGNYRLSTLKEIHAFVIDLDGMSPSGLKLFLKYSLKGLDLKPNMIVNSGSGLHLYYVLNEPFQVYKKYLLTLKNMNSSLQNKFVSHKSDYVVDKHSIIQPYRMVGSLTKLNKTVRAYIIEKKHYSITDIAKFTNVSFKSSYTKSKERIGVSQEVAKGNLAVFPNARSGFYDYMGARIYNEVDYGTRYMSMFALAVVAWKSRIPKSQLEEDLYDLQVFWNQTRPMQQIYDKEIEKALKGYNPKSTLVTSKQLEEWTGLEFNRTKRNGRTQKEHLDIVGAKKRGGNKELIKRFLEKNLNVSQRQISKELDLSIQTVNTCLKELKENMIISSNLLQKKNDNHELIINYLRENPNSTQREIASSLNLSTKTVNTHLNLKNKK